MHFKNRLFLNLFVLCTFYGSINYTYSVEIVENAEDLDLAIIAANGGGDDQIEFDDDITLPGTLVPGTLRPLNIDDTFTPVDKTFTIDGKGKTLNGDGSFRGFFIRGNGSGKITIKNLTIENTTAIGGDGGDSKRGGRGGGGAGLGGAIFVGAGSNVILQDVTFKDTKAEGVDG